MANFLLVLFCAILLPSQILGYNILLISPFCSKSHKNSIDPAITELVARGHRITEVATEVNTNSTGIRQYELKDIKKEIMAAMNTSDKNPFAPADKQQHVLVLLYTFITKFSRYALEDQTIKQFLKDTENEKFDVVIVNALFNEVSFPIAHKFNAPMVFWSPAGLFPYSAWTMNVPFPLSYVTSAFIYYIAPLSFIDRLTNTLFNSFLIFGRQYILVPAVESIYEQYYNESPSILDIEKNASLFLVNSHIAMEDARPTMPNIINVGAMHCKPANPLPKDLNALVTGSAPHGFIVFSLGSVVQGTQMPQELVDSFLRVFAKLKQKVLWKFEGTADNVPANVIFQKWLPQQDLMGHPNCRLAILHGGLNSLQEAVYHGVPVLGMPLGADRDSNLAIAVHKGVAEIFDWKTATDEILLQKVDQLLNNPKYRENAKRLSAVLKDQQETAAETAAYWIEYVARHKGAAHLKSNARNVNLFQYFLLDVFAFIITCVFLVLAVIWFAVKFSYRLLCRKTAAKATKLKTK